MKITQDLRAEVRAMGDTERAALEGITANSVEFLQAGGKLYVDADITRIRESSAPFGAAK